MIGVLILMGVVVNNGIVMIVHINQLRYQGHLRTEALVLGAKERLRPVLMTMATAILGMLPLAIGGAEAWSDAQLEALAVPLRNSGYGNYLLSLLREGPSNA